MNAAPGNLGHHQDHQYHRGIGTRVAGNFTIGNTTFTGIANVIVGNTAIPVAGTYRRQSDDFKLMGTLRIPPFAV